MRYADRHLEAFNEGKIAIVGERNAAFGVPLAIALWRMYAGCPEDRLNEDFPTDVILGYAREAAAAFDRNKKK